MKKTFQKERNKKRKERKLNFFPIFFFSSLLKLFFFEFIYFFVLFIFIFRKPLQKNKTSKTDEANIFFSTFSISLFSFGKKIFQCPFEEEKKKNNDFSQQFYFFFNSHRSSHLRRCPKKKALHNSHQTCSKPRNSLVILFFAVCFFTKFPATQKFRHNDKSPRQWTSCLHVDTRNASCFVLRRSTCER